VLCLALEGALFQMSDVDEFHERSWECSHPNFFFKEFKFYCRTCGKSEEDIEDIKRVRD